MNLEAFVISLVHLLTPTLQSTPATLLLFLRVCVSFHKLMVPHCPPPHLQPAPRARLLSLCTVTLESFRVSLSMALRSAGYSDWSMGYMPWGMEKTKDQVHFMKGGEFTYLESTYCTSERNNVRWRDFMFDCTPSDSAAVQSRHSVMQRLHWRLGFCLNTV